jgi:lauroyl/myristoyl acyltransferase
MFDAPNRNALCSVRSIAQRHGLIMRTRRLGCAEAWTLTVEHNPHGPPSDAEQTIARLQSQIEQLIQENNTLQCTTTATCS